MKISAIAQHRRLKTPKSSHSAG